MVVRYGKPLSFDSRRPDAEQQQAAADEILRRIRSMHAELEAGRPAARRASGRAQSTRARHEAGRWRAPRSRRPQPEAPRPGA